MRVEEINWEPESAGARVQELLASQQRTRRLEILSGDVRVRNGSLPESEIEEKGARNDEGIRRGNAGA